MLTPCIVSPVFAVGTRILTTRGSTFQIFEQYPGRPRQLGPRDLNPLPIRFVIYNICLLFRRIGHARILFRNSGDYLLSCQQPHPPAREFVVETTVIDILSLLRLVSYAMEVRDDLVNILFQKALWSCREAAVPPCDRETAEKTRISRKALPSTWSINSTVQLMPPKQSDSTDRTLFRRSYRAGFDPDGYRHHRGLRRPLFYKSGYLTCAKCNGVTFIDASALRTVLELKAKVDFGCIPPENLPSCVGCKETLGLRVGAHDFLRFIEGQFVEVTQSRNDDCRRSAALM